MYTGQRLDNDTGIYYYKARDYNPLLGRFLQRDPVGFKDSYNLYAYVGWDPVNYVDGFGMARSGSANNANSGFCSLTNVECVLQNYSHDQFLPQDTNDAWFERILCDMNPFCVPVAEAINWKVITDIIYSIIDDAIAGFSNLQDLFDANEIAEDVEYERYGSAVEKMFVSAASNTVGFVVGTSCLAEYGVAVPATAGTAIVIAPQVLTACSVASYSSAEASQYVFIEIGKATKNFANDLNEAVKYTETDKFEVEVLSELGNMKYLDRQTKENIFNSY